MKRLLILILLFLMAFLFTVLLGSSRAQVKIGGSAKIGGTAKMAVQASGGLTDFVTDTFTEAGTGFIDANTHVGELGASYTDHPHGNYPGPLWLDRDLDRIYGTGTSLSFASGTPASADYEVCADFYNVTTIAVNIGVTGRTHATDDTMYLGRLNGGTVWNMRKIVATVASDLGTNSTNNLPTAGGAPKRGCLVMVGDQISFTVEGVTEIGPVTDAAITAAGRPGFRTAGASSATTGMHIDNLSARQ